MVNGDLGKTIIMILMKRPKTSLNTIMNGKRLKLNRAISRGSLSTPISKILISKELNGFLITAKKIVVMLQMWSIPKAMSLFDLMVAVMLLNQPMNTRAKNMKVKPILKHLQLTPKVRFLYNLSF